jgi:hypothetical protein
MAAEAASALKLQLEISCCLFELECAFPVAATADRGGYKIRTYVLAIL